MSNESHSSKIKFHAKLPKDVKREKILEVYSKKPTQVKLEGYNKEVFLLDTNTKGLVACRSVAKDTPKVWVKLKK